MGSHTCGGGSKTRHRRVVTPGKGEPDSVEEVTACNLQLCCPECEEDVDCVWEAWSEWSDCSVTCAGGERSRYRSVLTMPTNRGKPCANRDSYEIAPCGQLACGEAEYCGWAEWEAWGGCSATCGGGIRLRERVLRITSKPTDDYLSSTGADAASYESARLDLESVNNELLSVQKSIHVANGAVCLSMVALAAVLVRVLRAPAEPAFSPLRAEPLVE